MGMHSGSKLCILFLKLPMYRECHIDTSYLQFLLYYSYVQLIRTLSFKWCRLAESVDTKLHFYSVNYSFTFLMSYSVPTKLFLSYSASMLRDFRESLDFYGILDGINGARKEFYSNKQKGTSKVPK